MGNTLIIENKIKCVNSGKGVGFSPCYISIIPHSETIEKSHTSHDLIQTQIYQINTGCKGAKLLYL